MCDIIHQNNTVVGWLWHLCYVEVDGHDIYQGLLENILNVSTAVLHVGYFYKELFLEHWVQNLTGLVNPFFWGSQ